MVEHVSWRIVRVRCWSRLIGRFVQQSWSIVRLLTLTFAGFASVRLIGGRARVDDPRITVEEVAQELGTATLTLYRHIPGGRSSLQGEAA